MKNILKSLSVLAIIVMMGVLFHHKYIDEFPSHIHAWAQCDRYALALGFIDNGFCLLKPQTMVYNHQFPGHWTLTSETTVTAVDCPIYDYNVALLMKLFGNTSPWVFRLYVLLYSFLGLFFLYKLAFLMTTSVPRSLFVLVFAATSPVYVYYQNGFLPTVPSLSNAIVGLYFYCLYLRNHAKLNYRMGVLFLTIAALARTTFAIPLIAVMCIESLRLLRKEVKLGHQLVPAGISALLILSYFFYNGYLRKHYGSIFLNEPTPPHDIAEAKDIVRNVFENWFFQYFSLIHYALLSVLLILAVGFVVARRSRLRYEQTLFGILTLAYSFGCFIFTLLMLQQFRYHDYYFLDSFFIPVLLLLIFLFSLLPAWKRMAMGIGQSVALGLVAVPLIVQPVHSQEERRTVNMWDKAHPTSKNYEGAAAFMDSLGIPRSSKILVLDAVAPNMPFLLRRGLPLWRLVLKI